MVSRLKVDEILTSGGDNLFAGNVINTYAFYYTGSTSFTGGPVGILSGVITPTKAGNHFLIRANIYASHTPNNSLYFQLNIDGDRSLTGRSGASYPSFTGSIYMEGYGSSHSANAQIDEYHGEYMYTHNSTSPFTALIEGRSQGGTAYMNRAYSYDDTSRGQPRSSLIIQEIAT